MHGERARDAQALLLTAGEGMGALVELVFHLIPQRTRAQSLLYKRIALVFALHKAMALRREQDVVANDLRTASAGWNTMPIWICAAQRDFPNAC